MTTESSEARIMSHTNTHWEITRAWYEGDSLHVEFQDGTGGTIPVSQFSALANATKEAFEDLQVSPCGLLIENGHIEWDCAEAGLYKLINSQQDR
jgi:Protein of unknown function (DUF2442)